MKMIRALSFAALTMLCAAAARAAETVPEVDVSTSAPKMLLSADAHATTWLQANYALKRALTKEQEKSLAVPKDGAIFAGDIFGDDTPGALRMEFSASKKTLTRFTVLRWTKNGWKPLLRCGRKGPLDAKGAAMTEAGPVDLYEIYLRKKSGALGFLLTLGDAGDRLYGDAIALSYDRRTVNYVWPDLWK